MYRTITLAVILVTSAFAQNNTSSPSWLMQNYRFTVPPAPEDIPPVNPTVATLEEIQHATLDMMHKAKIAGDYEAALAAAAQAVANAQLLANISNQLKPAPPPAQSPKQMPSSFKIALRQTSKP